MRSERQRIRTKLKEFCSLAQAWMDKENDTESLRDWYALLKKLEYLLYDLGMIIYEVEAREKDEPVSDSFDYDNLSPKEKSEMMKYFTRFQVGAVPFLFERYGNGYRAVLPYLLALRAAERVYFSPKRKFIVNVFESLLIENQTIIDKIPAATVLIVTRVPRREMPPRDNDNADAHDIINLIKDYLMKEDDSGLYLNVFYDTQISNNYYTEVYIMPHMSYRELIEVQHRQNDE